MTLMKKLQIKNSALICLSVLSCLVAWELFVKYRDISSIVLVPPSLILPAIRDNIHLLLKELTFTLEEAVYGWFIGNLMGILLAIGVYSIRHLSRLVIDLGVIINAIPLIALAAIIGGFIGTDQNAKVLIVAVLCFFPMLLVSTSTFASVNGDYRRLFSTYNAGRTNNFFKLIFPSSLPAILTVLKINVINAMSTAIVSEFFGAHGGIGQFILARKGFYDLPLVWAAIFLIIIVGSLFYCLISCFRKTLIKWG